MVAASHAASTAAWFNADVGHAFDFHKCIRASAAVARVVADGEAVEMDARAVAENDVFGMALRVAPEDRGPERRKSAPLECDVHFVHARDIAIARRFAPVAQPAPWRDLAGTQGLHGRNFFSGNGVDLVS